MGFYQGVALGLVITSSISYAVVTFTTFTAGTPISSSAVNANFATIKSKLDSLDVGMTGKLTSNYTVTCGTGSSMGTYPGDFVAVPMLIDTTDGNYNTATLIYTIPETAIYRMYFSSGSPSISSETSTDGGTTWTQNYATTARFTAGTLFRVISGCGTMDGVSVDIQAASFIFAIKKF